MFHLAAWSASFNSAALTEIAPINDGIIPIASGANQFIPEEDMWILGAMAMGATMTRARLNSALIRQINPWYIRPIEPAVAPGSRAGYMDLSSYPFRIRGQENLVAEVVQAFGGAERETVLALLAPVKYGLPGGIPVGNQFRIRWTSTTAAVANVWSLITVTYETGLPAGRYAVVNSTVFSANGQAHQMIFDNQYYRPGAPSVATAVSQPPWPFIVPSYGVWGTFYAYSPPRIQVLCNGADAVHEGYIDVIQLAQGAS